MPQKEKIFKCQIQDTRYKIYCTVQDQICKIHDTICQIQDARFKIKEKEEKNPFCRKKIYKNYAVVLCTVEVFGNKSKNTFIILSPGCNPCCAAGLPGCTAVTNIPLSLPPKHQTVKSRLNSRNINLIGSNKLLIEYVTNKSIKLSYKI